MTQDARWDVYSYTSRLHLLVITSVAPNEESLDATCHLEVWQVNDKIHIAGDLIWSHDFGAGPSGAFRPLVAMERHLAVATALSDYRGPLPGTKQGLTILMRKLADPVAESARVSDLLRATSEAYAYAYVDEWGLVVSTIMDGTVAVTTISKGDLNFEHVGEPLWYSRYDPALAGKETAALLNAFSMTPAPAEFDQAVVRQIADDTSISQWLKRFKMETRRDASTILKVPEPATASHQVWSSSLAAWSIRVQTTTEPAGPTISRVQALGGTDGTDGGRDLWCVEHPASISSPEEAHDDVVAVLAGYARRRELPTMRDDRHRLSVRLLTNWWHGPPVSTAGPPCERPAPIITPADTHAAELAANADPVPPAPSASGWH